MSSLASLARAWRAVFAIGIIAGSIAVVAPAVTAGAGLFFGGTFYVTTTGQDTGRCTTPATACATINYAISQATPDALIQVAQGVYNQQVDVTKNVTIAGSTAGPTVIEPSSMVVNGTDPNHSTNVYAIVSVNMGNDVSMRNLVINGAAAQAQFNMAGSCANDLMGVYYHSASGGLSNVAVDNISLGTSPNNLFGCQDGLGVYVASDPGSTSIVAMTKVSVAGFQKNGITCRDAGTSCIVNNSTVTGSGPSSFIAQNGIEGYGAGYLRVGFSQVSGDSYTGPNAQATGLLILDVGEVSVVSNYVNHNDVNVYLGSDGSGPTERTWDVFNNHVIAAVDNVPGGQVDTGDGIQVDSTTNKVVLNENTIELGAGNGISLLGASGVHVNYNRSYGNAENGIYVGGPGSVATTSSANVIDHNASNNNGQDGYLADTGSVQNAFTKNLGAADVKYDIQDLGTGNVWSGNRCNPVGDDSPSGLC